MKKREGFTLVELMAVIAILAIILAIVVPKVFRSISESKKRACNIQMNYITDAAATYFTKYRYNKKNSSTDTTYDEESKSPSGTDLLLVDLMNASLLKGTISNPVTDEELISTGTKVNIKNVDEVFVYTIYECERNPEKKDECNEPTKWVELVCE